jgi:hypothetical protein
MRMSDLRTGLAAGFCFIALAACSGGGGGGSMTGSTPAPSTSTPAPVTPAAPATPTNTLVPPAAASANGGAPTVATASTPNFTSSPPPKGTSFAFTQSVMNITATAAEPASIGAATLTILDPNAQGVMQLRFSVPALGVETTHLPLRGVDDGLATGGVVLFDMANLDYTLYGRWNYKPDARDANSRNYQGYATTGYQTAPSGVPSSGSATYFGAGTAQVAVVQQSNPQTALGGDFIGDTALNANFGNGTLTGTLSNLAAGNAKLHNVGLSGAISGRSVAGSTSIAAGATVSSAYAFSANSTGTFNGAFYGPNAQEVGAVWTLADPNGTKAAYGVFAGKKQ